MQDYKVGDMVWFSYSPEQKPKLGIVLRVGGFGKKARYDVVLPQHFGGGYTWQDIYYLQCKHMRKANG